MRTHCLTLFLAMLVLGLVFQPAARAADDNRLNASEVPLRLIISTDVAIGLIDTNGANSLTPVPFDASHPYTTDANVLPQDFDDGLTVAAALNMDAAGLVEVLAIVPTYGNASLPAEMLVARHITRTLKGRRDIPIAAGALAPAGQILNPTPTWFDGSIVKVTGAGGSFAAACGNHGVDLMTKILLDAGGFGSPGPVTILAIGPLTDIGCLLETAPKRALANIREIIVLGSQLEGEPTLINGVPIYDFNARIDPLAAAFMLAVDRVSVPMRFITFLLSRQTSLKGSNFPFNRATYPGPKPPTAAGRASFRWLLKASKPARKLVKDAFGSGEGPFDQYTLIAALEPHLFDCKTGYAYIQMCPFPAWSPKYPTDSNGEPTELPYNRPNNPCPGHGGPFSESYTLGAAQLTITTNKAGRGRLIRGRTGIDGNIPKFGRKAARKVLVCKDFASKAARARFENLLKTWTW